MKRPRVLLADDHTIVAEGLRSLLESDFELVGIVEDGRALVEAAARLRPDVVVTDVTMPLLNGIEAARQIRKTDSRIKVIFLTMHPEVAFATEALRAGAVGYLLKRSAASELVTAIREALKGRVYLTPLITKDVLKESVLAASATHGMPSSVLTPRQREVLQLVAEGHSIKEIAGILNISPKTVEFHKYSIMEELSLRTTAELTQYAIKHGVVSV